MDWLINLIPGGTVTAVVSAIISLVGGLIYFWRQAFKSGSDRKEVEHAKANRANLERIKRADRARPVGGVSDDPDNRDNDD
jgi:hypothetical protein